MQQCRNYLYDKSWPNGWYEVGNLVGGNARSVRRRAHLKVPRQRRCLTTSNCLRLLSIKKSFRDIFVIHFPSQEKKIQDLKHAIWQPFGGIPRHRGESPATGGNPPKMPGINTNDQPCVRIPSSASVASLPLHRYMKQIACHSIFIIFWNTENYYFCLPTLFTIQYSAVHFNLLTIIRTQKPRGLLRLLTFALCDVTWIDVVAVYFCSRKCG